MNFERGIWEESVRNFWANKFVVVIAVGLLIAVGIFQDYTHSTSGGGMWVEFAWLPVAIAAHATILNGQSGFATFSSSQYKIVFSPFLWRSIGLSFIGVIPAMAIAIPIVGTENMTLFTYVIMALYAAFESLILAKRGTMLPACVAEGDKSLKAASDRSAKIFGYVLGRFWSCNAVLLVIGGGGIILCYSIVVSFLKTLFTITDNVIVDIFLQTSITILLAFNLVMLATILSRAYLIAEGKVPPLESVNVSQFSGATLKKSASEANSGIWRTAVKMLWAVKWVAIIMILIIAVALTALDSTGYQDYAVCALPLALLPLAFTSHMRSLTGNSGIWPLTSLAPKSIWFPYAWRSSIFFWLVPQQHSRLGSPSKIILALQRLFLFRLRPTHSLSHCCSRNLGQSCLHAL